MDNSWADFPASTVTPPSSYPPHTFTTSPAIITQRDNQSGENASQAGSANGSRRAATNSKKAPRNRDAAGRSAGDEEDDDDEAPRKKGRLVLSCTECKRRKVKCDRKVPCSACIRRGAPESCLWDAEGSIMPDIQPFALATQFSEVSGRLEEIEAFLQTLPPDVKARVPRSRNSVDSELSGPSARRDAEAEVNDMNGVNSEMEKAVLDLEHTTFSASASEAGPPRRADDSSQSSSMSCSARPPARILEHAEPTTACTSILARPLVYEGPLSAVSLGLDFCLTEEEFYYQRDAAMSKVLPCLPSRDVSDMLLEKYTQAVSWFYSILHPPAFLAEYERWQEMVRDGRQLEVDPLWLAMYLMVLALGLDSAGNLNTQPYPDRNETCRTWYAASIRLFQLADWAHKPQFRVIQLCLLWGQWNHTSASGNDVNGYSSYLACAARVAVKLRLHTLGDDPSTMPSDDPAFPPGKNSVKRQTALRCFGILTFLDTISANGRTGAYMLHSEQITTAPLANLNISQLSTTEWKINAPPRSVWTDSSLEYAKWRGHVYMKMMFDRLVTHASQFSYATVLELDREARSLLAEFPDALAFENTRLDRANPILRKQRFVALCGMNSRLVRLHRPYVLMGYSDSKYRHSTDIALKSARATIVAHHNGRDALASIRIIFSHTLSAVIVVASNVFYLIDTEASDAELHDQLDLLTMALEAFDPSRVVSPMLSNVLTHGSVIISSLLEAAQRRRDDKLVRVGPALGVATFTQTLRDIAKTLQLAQSPAAQSTTSSGFQPLTPAAPSSVTFQSTPTFPSAVPQYDTSGTPSYPPQQLSHNPLPSFPTSIPSKPPPAFAPAYSAQFLSDMGLSTFNGASVGAFDPSFYNHPPPPPPGPLPYPPQLAYDIGPSMSQPSGYPSYQHPHQYIAEPAWAMEGQDGARALFQQISGP
ncbi:hypothetical protein JCM11641_005902 [Rhodosporidiobolus odoratus]